MEELKSAEPSSSISIEVEGDTYLDAIKGIMACQQLDGCQLIYVAATVSAESIMQAMELIGIDVSDVRFIDCISNMMTGTQGVKRNVIFIESPTMLESIMLKIEFIRKKTAKKRVIVVLDSLNTLHIHNDWKILGEFLHILVNSLRSRGAMIVILSIKEQQSQDLNMLLGLVSDRTVRAGGD